jgi:hypothetical protein
MSKRRGVLRAAIFGSLLAGAFLAGEGCAGGGGGDESPLPSNAGGPNGGSGGGGPSEELVASTRSNVKSTLDHLAALGPKRAGTPGGYAAGDYVKGRLEAALGRPATFETFSFRQQVMSSASLDVNIGGSKVAMAYDAFAYTGEGRVDAEVVSVGKGHAKEYEGKDVAGKIVFVVRDPLFHRQAQYREALAHGAAGFLYASQSPNNLIQVGTVSNAEDGMALMPTITVGKDDGAKIQQALAAGQPTTAVLGVTASLRPAQGRNVIGYLPGTDPSGAFIMVGAHYDTWSVGATDNGTGVAAMLELAERVGAAPARRLGVMFVGFDAEELGLLGAYDFLRKHVIVNNEPMLGFINLEMPAGGPKGGGMRAIASTNGGPIAPAADESGLTTLYPFAPGLEVVPSLFGGIIPTDVQGMYWHGLQGLTTYCETDYYHTVEDTPDKVDTEFLARVTLALYDALGVLDDEPVQSFRVHDEKVWDPTITTAAVPGAGLDVTVVARDVDGVAQPGAAVQISVHVDDFTRVFEQAATADASGTATVRVPADALAAGQGGRWMHVTAGRTFPLAERVQPLP